MSSARSVLRSHIFRSNAGARSRSGRARGDKPHTVYVIRRRSGTMSMIVSVVAVIAVPTLGRRGEEEMKTVLLTVEVVAEGYISISARRLMESRS